MQASSPQISVVVSTRDRAEGLAGLLRSLREQTLDPSSYEVIVVDNGSRDATAELLARETRRSPHRLTVLTRARGEGPAPARNEGWRAASAPVIAFTDDDCEADPGWLEQGLLALQEADLVQGAVRPDPGVVPGPFDRTLWVDHETGFYETASLFVRRDLLEKVDGFEPLLPSEVERVIGEDAWLGWRARRAGARTAFSAAALVHHAVIARGPAAMIAERWRLRHFPLLATRIPELRGHTFFAGVFLSRRTARFDLAALALALAAAKRSRLPLPGALPYLRQLLTRALPRGRAAPIVAAAELAADVVGLVALLVGSVRARRVLL